MPVLPAVPSTTTPPGRNSPLFTASSMMNKAARSLTDWPGFMNSALPRIVQPVCADTRSSFSNGVLPIASMIPLRTCIVMMSRRREAKRSLDNQRLGNKPRSNPCIKGNTAETIKRQSGSSWQPIHRLFPAPALKLTVRVPSALLLPVLALFGAIWPRAMNLDVNTLFLVTIYVEAILGLLLLFAWVQNTSIHAVAWWGFDDLLRALSVMLF